MALFCCVFMLTLLGCAVVLTRILYHRRCAIDLSASARLDFATRRTLLSPQQQRYFVQVIKACRYLNDFNLASALLFVHVPLHAVVDHAPHSMAHKTLDIVLTNARFIPVIAFTNDQTSPDMQAILKRAGILVILLSESLSDQHMQQHIKDALLRSDANHPSQ